MINSKNIATILFVILVTVLSVIFYKSTIKEFPKAVHAWTQSDRYAIALKFLDNGFDFFHPATYNLKGKNGITQVDFPINEYVVAIVMKVCGTMEPGIFRICVLLYCLLGLYFLFKLVKLVTDNYLLGLMAVAFVFTLPFYCYYQAGFIPSAPAFSSALIGVYFLYNYSQAGKRKDHLLSILFFTLAALTRLPFTIFLLALLGMTLIIGLKNKSVQIKKIFPVIVGIIFVGLYYIYNRHLAKEYGTIFWMDPLYISNWQMFKEIVKGVKERWLMEYFTLFHYVIFLLALCAAIVNRKKITIYLKEINSFFLWLFFTFAGAAAYFFVNGRQYIDHDYYFIDSFLLPIIIMLVLLFKFVSFTKQTVNYGLMSLFALLLTGATYKCYSSQQWRYATNDKCEQARQSFVGSEEYLDSMGISKESKLMVIEANTYNTPFIYMKRNGYTVLVCRNGDMHAELLDKDFDYVIIPNRFIVNDVLPYAPYLLGRLRFVSSNGKISLYKLNKEQKEVALDKFLGIKKTDMISEQHILFDGLKPDSTWQHVDRIDSANYFSSPFSYKNDSSQEYGITYSLRTNEFADMTNRSLIIKAKIKLPYMKNIISVIAIDGETNNLHYDSYSFDRDYISVNEGWQDIIYQFDLSGIYKDGKELKVYFWNPDKTTFWLDDVEVLIYKY